MSNVLVTGGQGFIGSHACKELRKAGHRVVSIDWLQGSIYPSVPHHYATHYVGNIGDKKLVQDICVKHNIDSVMHFAAFASVEESEKHPEKYYENNINNMIKFMDAVLSSCNLKHFIFSSSCSVYGTPQHIQVDEETPLVPESVYGLTKKIGEDILTLYSKIYSFNTIFLRYFNVAGADPDGTLGENHEPETHLIPLLLKSNQKFKVYGNNYNTPDGTCVRDFVHVTDLARAHVLALSYAQKSKTKFSDAFCLGSGSGYTVLDVLKTAEKVTGKAIPYEIAPRRKGDAEAIYASNKKAQRLLGWKSFYNLTDMIKHAHAWYNKCEEK